MPRDHLEHRGQIQHRSGEWTDGVAGVGRHDAPMAAHAAVGGSHAANTVDRSWSPNGTAGVFTQREAALTRRCGDTRTRGGARSVVGNVPRVFGLAVRKIQCAALAKLMQILLTQKNGTCSGQAVNGGGGEGRLHLMLVQHPGSHGGFKTQRVHLIFDAKGNAMQWAADVTLEDVPFGLTGRSQGLIRPNRDPRTQGLIGLLDASKAGLDQLDR